MFPKFDVIIKCQCGRRVVLHVKEHPGDNRRWRCTVCGEIAKDVEIWPIWARAFRGDPRDKLE